LEQAFECCKKSARLAVQIHLIAIASRASLTLVPTTNGSRRFLVATRGYGLRLYG
jgi:hypothetical protein